jgi:predicted PurR-regulated permease PerM
MEKRWTPTSKRLIVVGAVIALYLLLSRIATILPPLVITLIVAYILSPIADFLASQLRLNRTLAVALIYLVLIAIIITTPALLIPPLIEQIENFVDELPKLVREIGELYERPIVIGDFTLELQDVYNEATSSIEGLLSSLATQTINILTNIASALFWTLFILFASFYLVKDSAIILQWMDEVTPPNYRHDFRQLRTKIASAWNAFLRGQLILCVVMGLVVGTTMALIGLHNAWLIGVLFGILEFIPNLGPTIASVPTILIAFIDGSTILNISNGWFAVLVIGVNFALQQLENNFLVPRIMGQSLNLHPLVVLIAALIGAQMAGVLGILLAAPVVATLRVLAEYTYYRLLDMPPFPEQRVPSAPETKDQEAVKEDEPSIRHAQPATASEADQAK